MGGKSIGSVWKGRMCWAVMRVARRTGGRGFSGGDVRGWMCGRGLSDLPPHAFAYWNTLCFASVAVGSFDGIGILVVVAPE